MKLMGKRFLGTTNGHNYYFHKFVVGSFKTSMLRIISFFLHRDFGSLILTNYLQFPMVMRALLMASWIQNFQQDLRHWLDHARLIFVNLAVCRVSVSLNLSYSFQMRFNFTPLYPGTLFHCFSLFCREATLCHDASSYALHCEWDHMCILSFAKHKKVNYIKLKNWVLFFYSSDQRVSFQMVSLSFIFWQSSFALSVRTDTIDYCSLCTCCSCCFHAFWQLFSSDCQPLSHAFLINSLRLCCKITYSRNA